ncbi:MAG: hypothetical protein ABR611_15275 [Chthoniobacterales bacterium]
MKANMLYAIAALIASIGLLLIGIACYQIASGHTIHIYHSNGF